MPHDGNASCRSCGLPGCILLDLQLPGFDGLDLQSRLVAMNNILPIVFLTGHGDIPMSVRAIKAGAVDFLTKPVKRDDLLRAVRASLGVAHAQAGAGIVADSVPAREFEECVHKATAALRAVATAGAMRVVT